LTLLRDGCSGEYLFDHRNGTQLREWLMANYIGGMTGVDHPDVFGIFVDDDWYVGLPAQRQSIGGYAHPNPSICPCI